MPDRGKYGPQYHRRAGHDLWREDLRERASGWGRAQSITSFAPMRECITRSGPYNFTTLDTYQGTEIFSATLAATRRDGDWRRTRRDRRAGQSLLNDIWLMVSYATAPVPMRALHWVRNARPLGGGGTASAGTRDTSTLRMCARGICCQGRRADGHVCSDASGSDRIRHALGARRMCICRVAVDRKTSSYRWRDPTGTETE